MEVSHFLQYYERGHYFETCNQFEQLSYIYPGSHLKNNMNKSHRYIRVVINKTMVLVTCE